MPRPPPVARIYYHAVIDVGDERVSVASVTSRNRVVNLATRWFDATRFTRVCAPSPGPHGLNAARAASKGKSRTRELTSERFHDDRRNKTRTLPSLDRAETELSDGEFFVRT